MLETGRKNSAVGMFGKYCWQGVFWKDKYRTHEEFDTSSIFQSMAISGIWRTTTWCACSVRPVPALNYR